MKVANIIMALLFLFSLVVQYNDPDPVRWMAIYGSAAAACLWAVFRSPVPRWLTGLVGLGALVWIGLWLPKVLGQVSFGEMFREAGMATLKIEEGREVIGLLLVAIWMVVLFLRPGQRQRS